MANIVVSVLILLYISSKVSTISPGTFGGCMKSDGTRYCCSGFYEENDICLECIGYVGYNCTKPCPPEWFGPRCTKPCPCSDSECDNVLGCVQESMSTDSKPDSTISDYVYASTSIEHTSISTSKEFTSKEVLLEDLSKSGGPWERLVHFIRTVNTEYWAIISSILCILVFAALCVIIVLCRKKGRGKQTNTDHRLYTSNRYIEQTDGERYCDLNTYTDPLEVKMNVCFGGHQVAQGTTEYMHSDSMFEERTDSHEYVSMNTHCYTELSNVNDSKPKDYGSSEHVYMRI